MDQQLRHQTVRLGPGRHAGPEHGACVMELVSMLAGEPFSDRPRTACPIIGAFLRPYNDGLDAERRQDLYELASLVVGTAADRRTTRRRIRACRAELARLTDGRRWTARYGGASAAAACAQAMLRNGDHERALAFVRRLVAMGPRNAEVTVPQTPPVEPVPRREAETDESGEPAWQR